MKKAILQLCLCLTTFFILSVNNLVAQTTEDGTTEHPFLIESLEELMAFRHCINTPQDSGFYFANGTYMLDTAGTGYTDGKRIRNGGLDSYFKLTCNITLNQGNVAGCNGDGDPAWEQWIPIGMASGSPKQSFMGDFDGGGHYISGLYFNQVNANAIGLFGCITDGAHVHNVALINSYIRSVNGHYIGGIVGWNIGSTVDHCFNASTIIGLYSVGGIVGESIKGEDYYAEASSISYCYNTGSIRAEGSNSSEDAGGIAGTNRLPCSISYSYNAGTVLVENEPNNYVDYGGIAGENRGTVEHCYTDENMCGQSGLGESGNTDVAGSNGLRTTEMTNGSWSQVGTQNDWKFVPGYYPQLKIFTETDAKDASLFSVTPIHTLNNDLANDLHNNVTLGGNANGVIWASNSPARADISSGNSYLLEINGKGEFILSANSGDSLYKAIYLESATGDAEGSINNPFTIDNKEDLITLRDNINNGYEFIYKKREIPTRGLNTYFLLTADINLNGEETNDYLSWDRNNAPSLVWTPVGKSEEVSFAGHFMGGGHTISGLYGASLFGVVDTNASVTDLGIGVGNSLGDGGYVTDGLVIWLDGEQNTRHGHDENAKIWENLAGPNYDFTAYDFETMQWNKNSFFGTGLAGRWLCGAQWREIYNMEKQNYFTVEAVAWVNYNKTTPTYRTLVGTFRTSTYDSYGFSMYQYSYRYMPMDIYGYNNITTLSASNSCYVNGNSSNYSNFNPHRSISYSSEPIILGNGYNNERCWNDSIYGLRIYSRQLTAAEIQQNYQADHNHFVLGYSLREASLVSKNLGTVSDCFSAMDNAPIVYENSGTVSHCYNMGRFNEEGNATLVAVNQAEGTVEHGYYAGTSDHVLKLVGVNFGTINNMYYDRQMAPRMNDAMATAKTTVEMTAGNLGLPNEHWTQSPGSYPCLTSSATTLAAKMLAAPLTLASLEDVCRVSTAFTLCNTGDEVEWKVAEGGGVSISGCQASIVGYGDVTLQARDHGWVYRTATLTLASPSGGYEFFISDLQQLKIFRDGINSGKNFYYNSGDKSYSLVYEDSHRQTVPANGKGARFILMSDIDMSGESDWIPIGSNTSSFQGEFDGNNKIVHDANWTMVNFQNGLFGVAERAVIRNLGMTDCNFKGRNRNSYQDYANYTGFICASFDGTMDGCYTKHCKVSLYNNSSNYFNGGIVGGLLGSGFGVMRNCYAQEDTMTMYFGYNYNVFYGGLAGSFSGKATNSYVKDSYIYTRSDCNTCGYSNDWHGHFGGLFGQVSSDTIANCYNDHSALYCEDLDHGYLGGIAGGSVFATTFYRCYNTASVSGCRYVAGICPAYITSNTFENCFNTGEIVIRGNSNGNDYEKRAAGIGDGNAKYCFNVGEIFNLNEGNNSTNRYVAGIVNAGSVISCYNAGWVKGLNTSYTGSVYGQGNSANSYNTGKYVNNYTSNDYRVGFNDEQMAPYAPADNNNAIINMVSSSLSGSLGDDANWVFTPGKYPMLKGLEHYDAAIVSVSPIYLHEGEHIDSVHHDVGLDTTMGVSWQVLEGNAVSIEKPDTAKLVGTGSVTLGAYKNGVLYKKVYLVVGFSQDSPLIIRNLEELGHFRDGINSGVDFYYKDEAGNEGYSADTTGGYYVRVPAFGEGAWFLQTADIDMSPVSNWLPIGNNVASGFMGVYDGGHHTLSNMSITGSNQYSGLFARMGQASGIKNLGLINPNISSDNNSSLNATGSLVAFIDGSAIRYVDSCYVKGANITAYQRVGALIGRSNAPISHCYADSCTLNVNSHYGGGLVGYANNTITDCHVSNTSITTSNSNNRYNYRGGIAGYAAQTISKSKVSNTTITNGGSYTGGIVGYIITSQANLKQNSAINVNISNSSSYTGGILGYAYNIITIDSCVVQGGSINSDGSYIGGISGYFNNSYSNVLHCRNMGMTIEGSSYVGGICGYGYYSYIRYCSNFAKVTGMQYTGGIVGYSYYYTTIEYCYNVGDILSSETGVSSQYIGGITGYQYYGSIRYCFNSGRVKGSPSGTIATGGICGYNYYGSAPQYCYNVGEVSTGQQVGGIIGYGYANYGYNAGRVSSGTTSISAIGSNNSNYTFYDYQMCPTAVWDSTGRKRNTSKMIGNELKGNTLIGNETVWAFRDSLYPQLKYFAESPDSLDRAASRVSATPVFLYVNSSGDTVETVNNVTHTVTFGHGNSDEVRWERQSGSGLIVNDNIGTPTDTIGVVVTNAYLNDTLPYKCVRFLMNITEDNALVIKDYPNLKIFRDGINSGKVFYYQMTLQEFDTASHAGDDNYMEIPVGGEDVYFRLAENTYDLSDTTWIPIGTQASPFKGNFNGGHQTIENMNINFKNVDDHYFDLTYLRSLVPTKTILMNSTSSSTIDTLHDNDVIAFYDDGGPENNYSNTWGQNRYQAFKAEPGKQILVYFKNFSSYNYNERLSFGHNTNANNWGLSGNYSNYYYISTGEYFYFRWYSYSQSAAGWEAIVIQVPISDISANVPTTSSFDYQGFFGTATGNYIKNLNFTNAKVTGHSYVGTLAGVTASIVDSVFAYNDSLTATGSYVGGLIGRSENSISHCNSEQTFIKGIFIPQYTNENKQNWGGICGYQNTGSLNYCYTIGGNIHNNMYLGNSNYSSSYTGGIVGCNNNAQISYCGNSSTVYGDDYVGGIAGRNNNSVPIKFSYNTGKINGSGNGIGGIVGYYGTAAYCINTGDITSKCNMHYKNIYVGGIIGYDDYRNTYMPIYNSRTKMTDNIYATTFYCINTGTISTTNEYSGYEYYSNGICTNTSYYSINAGEIYGKTQSYGISGSNYYSINIGRVHGNGDTYSVINSSNSFNDKQMCPGSWTTTYNNAEKTTTQIISNEVKNNIDSTYWIFEEGMYPRLRWTDTLEWARKMALVACTPMHLSNSPVLNTVNTADTIINLGGNDSIVWKKVRGNGFVKVNDYQYKPAATMGVEYFGAAWHEFPDSIYKVIRLINCSEDKPVIIKNKEELVKFRNYINSGNEFYYDPIDTVFYASSNDTNHILIPALGESIYFRLDANDADLSDITYWTPIGNNNNPFKGYFNGNHKEISGMTTNGQYSGLFGYAVDASIKNVKLTDAKNTGGSNNYNNSALLCGYANRTTLFNDTVSSSQMTVNANTSGGICGQANACTIKACCLQSTTINTSSSYNTIGGICGLSSSSLIDSCNIINSNITSVYSSNNVGGICGSLQSAKIRNCSSQHSIISSNSGRYVGGICGFFNSNDTIFQCYNSSSVKGAEVGGICGFINNSNGLINRCFNTGEITDNNYTSASFNMGGICSNGKIYNSYNAGRIIAKRAAATGGIVGNGTTVKAEKCYNIGYLRNEGSGTIGMIIGNTSTVHNSFNDVQMNPNGIIVNSHFKKSTVQMTGNALYEAWGDDDWVYTPGMYPMLKGMDTIANAIAYAIPVYLYGAQHVDMVRTQYKVGKSPDGSSSWSGPEHAFDLAVVNTLDTVKVRSCGLDTVTVSYKGQQKVLPMNVDRLEVTFIDAHTCGETYTWNVSGKLYTRSGNYTEAYALSDKCDSIVTLRLFIPTKPLALYPQFSDISCYGKNDGKLDAIMDGGSGSYKVLWLNETNDTVSKQAHVENLSPGIYTILLFDSLYDDCSLSESVNLTQPDSLEASILSSSSGCYDIEDGYIEIFIKGGTAPYYVTCTNGTETRNPEISEVGVFRLSNLPDGDWTIDVEDKNHCQTATLHCSIWQDKRSFVVRASSLDKLYDGVTVTVDTFNLSIDDAEAFVPVLDANGEYEIYDSTGYYKDFLHVTVSGVSRKDAGTEYNNITTCEVIRRYADSSIPNDTITCRYNIATYDGIVNIRQRELTITSPTYAQVGYFDEPISRPTVEFGGDGLASGDTVICSGFPILTDYGIVSNTYDTVWTPAGISSNYNVMVIYGTLAVTHDTLVIIIASSASKTYDCTPLSSPSYSFVTAPHLPDSIVLTASIADTCVITDAGTRVNHIASYQLYDTVHHRYYTNVYNVQTVDGTLTVRKRRVELASMSAERNYNAQALTRPELISSGDGFAPCDTVGGISVIGSQTEPGSSTNTISYTTTSSFKPSNYDITINEGILKVNKQPMTIAGDRLELTYDGNTHELTTIHVSGLVSGQHIQGLNYSTGAYRSVGRYPGKFTGTLHVIAEDNTTDVTHCYDIATPYKEDTLIINKIKDRIHIASQSADKVYDGKILVHEVYDVYRNGVRLSPLNNNTFVFPYTNDTIHISSDYTANKDVDTVDNAFNYVITNNGADVSENYTNDSISFSFGKLIITPRPLTLISDSITITYNGYPVSIPNVDVSGYGFAIQEGDIMEGATFTNFAAPKNVGVHPNTFEIVFNEHTLAKNYKIDTILGNITIKPAILLLTAEDATRNFCESTLPTFTYRVDGLLGADDRTAITSDPTITTTATLDSVVGTYPIIMDASTATAQNYIFTSKDGTLTIVPCHISLSTASDTVVYDATPHSLVDQFETFEEEINGHIFTANFSAVHTQTGVHSNAGVYPNVFTGNISDIKIMQGTEDFSSNFFIDEVKEGKLVINPDTLTVTAQDTNRMYGVPEPGFRSVITGFNGTDTREGSVFGSISYNTESNISSIPDGGSLAGGKYWILSDVSALTSYMNNYVFRADTGALTILNNSLTIHITSETDTFVYDGHSHTHHVYAVTHDGTDIPAINGSDGLKFRLPAGDTLTITPASTASITNVGKVTNSFSYTLQHDIYYTHITTFEDTLVMIPCPVDVTVTGRRDTTTYDATEHHVDGFDISCSNSLYSISDVTMSGTAYAARIDSGVTRMNLTASQFSNTNNNFIATITIEDGWQMISPITDLVTVKLKKKGAESSYDGYEQRVTGYNVVSIDNTIYQNSYFNYNGSTEDTIVRGRYVGSYQMGMEASDFENINPNFTNVNFVVEDDSLVIKPNPNAITITGGSAEKTYDGTTLTSNTYSYTDGVLAQGDTLIALVEGSITNAGDSLNRIVEYKVYRDESHNGSMLRLLSLTPPGSHTKDVTDCYTFATPEAGHLRITPNSNASVVITGHQAEYEYNGTIQSVHGFEVVCNDTLGIYSAADFHFTGDSTISASAVGTYTMPLSSSDFVNDNGNYNPVTFTVTNGSMIIYDSLAITKITTDSVTCKEYHDGEVSLTIAGGKRVTSPFYSYEIEGINSHENYSGTTDGSINLTGLRGDTYNVLVTDALAYTATATFTIEERNTLTASITTPTTLCSNLSSYTLEVTTTGGNGGNHYTWYNTISDGAIVADTDDTITSVNKITGNDCGHIYQIAVLVKDQKGCEARDTIIFTITDDEDPQFIAPADITICRNAAYEIDASTTLTGAPDPANITDNCTPTSQLIVSFTDVDTTGTDNDRRVIHRVWKVTDLCGRYSEQTQNITVCPAINNSNSTFSCPPDIDTIIKNGGCQLTLQNIGTPTFSTNTVLNPNEMTISNNAPTDHVFNVGETTITWTVTDSCGFSITCDQIIKVSFQTCPDAVDFEGNSYPSVRLGSGCKCWTTENLVSTKYSDGRDIDDVMDYYSYEYPDVATNVSIFGHLYNWYAAADTARYGSVDSVERAYHSGNHIQGICPDGWYLPSDEEYDELNIYPTTDLRSTEYWIRVNGVVNTNATGFNSLPGGMYNCSTGRFESMMGNSYYWTCHPVYDLATGAMIDYICEKIVTNNNSRCNGYSIRCIWGEH